MLLRPLTRSRKLTRRLGRVSRRLERLRNFRLTFGALFFIGLVVLAVKPSGWVTVSSIFAFLVFLVFYVISQKVQTFFRRLTALNDFYLRQESRQKRDFSFFQEHQKPSGLSLDLDLTGGNSLESLCSEVLTEHGDELLRSRLTKPPELLPNIKSLQALNIFLSHHSGFVAALCARVRAEGLGLIPTNMISKIIGVSLLGEGFEKYHKPVWIFWGLFVLSFFLPFPQLRTVLWVLFFGTNLFLMKTTEETFNRAQTLERGLVALKPVIGRLEVLFSKNRFGLEVLSSKRFSKVLKGLRRSLALLSSQGNPIIHLGLNAIFPWTDFAALRAEKRRKDLTEDWDALVQEISQYEVASSFSLLKNFFPTNYPSLTAEKVLSFSEATHPLLVNAVPNTFDGRPGVYLVTGSNMSGKSTFLRTIGTNQVLAQNGAPVFAQSFSTTGFLLGASIRVSDSIQEGQSYFLAEVRRLKSVIDLAHEKKPTLVLVDELFRGTNNRERKAGAEAIIQELLKTEQISFVTTHDLELTETPGVSNWHFTDEVREGRLSFPWKILPGPSETTNAIQIMADAGLPIPLPH